MSVRHGCFFAMSARCHRTQPCACQVWRLVSRVTWHVSLTCPSIDRGISSGFKRNTDDHILLSLHSGRMWGSSYIYTGYVVIIIVIDVTQVLWRARVGPYDMTACVILQVSLSQMISLPTSPLGGKHMLAAGEAKHLQDEW